MKVERLMTKDVRSCTLEQSLNDVVYVMWELDCGCVPITSEDGCGRVVGMLTDRDACMAAYFNGTDLKQLQARDAMSPDLHACKPSDTIAEAEQLMRTAQVRRLPVVDDAGQLLGLISLADISRAAARIAKSKSRKKQITEAEIGETLAAICRRHPRNDTAAAPSR
jgi:CBS domain-containing protein